MPRQADDAPSREEFETLENRLNTVCSLNLDLLLLLSILVGRSTDLNRTYDLGKIKGISPEKRLDEMWDELFKAY